MNFHEDVSPHPLLQEVMHWIRSVKNLPFSAGLAWRVCTDRAGHREVRLARVLKVEFAVPYGQDVKFLSLGGRLESPRPTQGPERVDNLF